MVTSDVIDQNAGHFKPLAHAEGGGVDHDVRPADRGGGELVEGDDLEARALVARLKQAHKLLGVRH